MKAVQALSDGLKNFSGGIVLVSHDRRLIQALDMDCYMIDSDCMKQCLLEEFLSIAETASRSVMGSHTTGEVASQSSSGDEGVQRSDNDLFSIQSNSTASTVPKIRGSKSKISKQALGKQEKEESNVRERVLKRQ